MNRLTAQEMAEQFKTQKDPIQLYKDMDWFINSFSIPKKEFLNVIKELKPRFQKRWTNICLLWCLKLSELYSKGYYDDRNKQSCMVSQEVVWNYRSSFPDKTKFDFENQFVDEMARTHRTLQQNFSGIVFLWFKMEADAGKSPFKALVKKLPERFYYLPCI